VFFFFWWLKNFFIQKRILANSTSTKSQEVVQPYALKFFHENHKVLTIILWNLTQYWFSFPLIHISCLEHTCFSMMVHPIFKSIKPHNHAHRVSYRHRHLIRCAFSRSDPLTQPECCGQDRLDGSCCTRSSPGEADNHIELGCCYLDNSLYRL